MASPDSQTEALDEKFLELVTVKDREYQKYSIDHQIFYEPVDDDEAKRLDSQHQIFHKVFDHRLIFPPTPRLRKVLDCGHGDGSWALELAEQHPECKVIGVDISPHMNPEYAPDNLILQVDDLNHPFTFSSNCFDFAHSRLLATGINVERWPSYIRDIKRVLKPGGWVQLVEIYFNVQSDNGSITEENALRQWSTQFMRSLETDKNLRVATQLRNLLMAAGLTEVDARMIPLPLSAWSPDPRMREIGALNSENTRKLLPAISLYPLTQRMGMPLEVFDDLIARAQHEASLTRLKAYFPLYVCIGRKAL